MTVVKTTIDTNQLRGSEVAFAAALVEMVHTFIAICFGFAIASFLETNTLFKLVIALAFISLAVFIFTRQTNTQLVEQVDVTKSFLKRGLFVATINPQAVPFWIFALAAISQTFEFRYEGVLLVAFLAGAFAGKLAALYGFVVAAGYLKNHISDSARLVNHVLAGILFFIGVSQAWTVLG